MASDKETVVALITPQEIHAFIRRARAELRAVQAAEDRAPPLDRALHEQLSDRAEAASRMLEFCVEAAGWTCSPSLMPFLISMLRGRDEDDDDDEYEIGSLSRPGRIAHSVRRILAAGAPVTKEVAKLARSHHTTVRHALAEALSLKDPAALPILETLATTDDSDLVRKTARERLAVVRDIAWWQGKFSRDPLAGASPADAERLRAPLETIAQLLELAKWDRRKRTPELAGAIAQLPDAPALDVLARLLSDPAELDDPESLLLRQFLTKDHDGSVLPRLVESWAAGAPHRCRISDRVREANATAGTPARRTFAQRLLDDTHRRADRNPIDKVAVLAVEVMAALWPAEDDPSPVLDALLAEGERSGESYSDLQNAYWQLLRREDLIVRPLFPRLAEARRSGYPPPWEHAAWWWDQLLDRAATGPELRDIAAHILANQTDPYAVGWALQQQIERAHDPSRDPPPPHILRLAWGEPHLRAAIVVRSDLVIRTVPSVREDLRADRLAYDEAGRALRAIGELWGGIVSWSYPSNSTPEYEEQQREKYRQNYIGFLGPERLHGPPTEIEWGIFRALRDTTLASSRNDDDWWHAIRVLPSGEWTAADRDVLFRAMEMVRTEHHDHARFLASTLATHPEEAWLPLMDELAAMSSDDGDMIQEDAARMRRALGIRDMPDAEPPANPAPDNPTPAARPAPQVEWMDEPEDEP